MTKGNEMMKKMSLVLGLAVAAAPGAQAAPLNVNGPTSIQCLTVGSISSCASVNVTLVGSTFTAIVRSIGVAPTNTTFNIHSFGFFYLTGSGSPSLTLSPTSGHPHYKQNGFTNGAPDLVGGSPGTWLGGANFKSGPDKIFPETQKTFTFALTGTLPSEIYFAYHGGGWDGPGGSFKCYGNGKTTTDGAECGPPTVVPEPGTVVLLATGLAGLVAGNVVRRRRRNS